MHNLEQAEMGERLSVSQPVYSRYESGCKYPNEDFIMPAAVEFKNWLLREKPAGFALFIKVLLRQLSCCSDDQQPRKLGLD